MYLIEFLILIITYVLTESTLCGNWTEFEGQKCIHIIDKEKFVNYENAMKMCAQTEKSHLITINSENEQKLIEKYLKDKQILNNVWIGLKNENGFKWSDKSSVDYTNWADKSPINETDLNCVQISSETILKGKWVNGNCIKKAVVICQKTIDIKKIIEENKKLQKENEELKVKLNETNKTKFIEKHLISRIKQFHSHYNISKPFIDFDNKQKVLFTVWNSSYQSIHRTDPLFSLCESLNSNIIEIRSKQKHEIVDKQIIEWKAFSTYTYFWLNGIRDSSGKWRWNTDGMEFNYTNWGEDYPSSAANHDFLLIQYFFSSKNTIWRNSDNSDRNNIICEHELQYLNQM